MARTFRPSPVLTPFSPGTNPRNTCSPGSRLSSSPADKASSPACTGAHPPSIRAHKSAAAESPLPPQILHCSALLLCSAALLLRQNFFGFFLVRVHHVFHSADLGRFLRQ